MPCRTQRVLVSFAIHRVVPLGLTIGPTLTKPSQLSIPSVLCNGGCLCASDTGFNDSLVLNYLTMFAYLISTLPSLPSLLLAFLVVLHHF